MGNEPYNKREMDTFFENISNKLDRIEAQTTKHNGRLTKLERYILIVACVTGTMLVMSGSEFINFVAKIFI